MKHWAEFLPGFNESNLFERSRFITRMIARSRRLDEASNLSMEKAYDAEDKLIEAVLDRYSKKEIKRARAQARAEGLKPDENIYVGSVEL